MSGDDPRNVVAVVKNIAWKRAYQLESDDSRSAFARNGGELKP